MLKRFLIIAALLPCLYFLVGCEKVPAGYVGIKVYMLGSDKGVDSEELGVGKYYLGLNEELYLYPIFQQNYVWSKSSTEGDGKDESMVFQTKEGLEVSTNIGISYTLKKDKINVIFQKYRLGIDELTNVYLRNMVRDALNLQASKLSVEDIIGAGKQTLMQAVQDDVSKQVKDIGITIDKIYVVGNFILPAKVVAALNSKIEANQRAAQRENEIREAEAEAQKTIAAAEGEAKALQIKNTQITPMMLQYEALQRWDGKLPQYMNSNSMPFINIK